MCVKQAAQKLPRGCVDVSIANLSHSMTLSEFKEKLRPDIDGENMEAIENQFWAGIMKERIYSINNLMTLFGDATKVWNLDTFTRDQSNIHSKPSHRFLKVNYITTLTRTMI